MDIKVTIQARYQGKPINDVKKLVFKNEKGATCIVPIEDIEFVVVPGGEEP